MIYNFVIGDTYSRKNVKKIIGAENPDSIGGIWGTGYIKYNSSFFIFANITTQGRTGHNYHNILNDNSLYWYTKNRDHLNVPTISEMTSGDHEVYIFTRNNSDDIFFTFKGLGYIKDLEDGHPANIVWGFTNDLDNKPDDTKRKKFIEGARLSKTYTVYERNRAARAKCLQHYGYKCAVCDFDFNKVYGEIGENFIHVHHEKELSSIGEEYMLDPINDLKPVCPNCHAMLHKRKPAYSLQELKNIIHN